MSREDLRHVIMEAAVERVRSKMMTVTAIMAGLMPILRSTGTGSELMERLPSPWWGGMVSSTMLTLLVIPAIYALLNGWNLLAAWNRPPHAMGWWSAPRRRTSQASLSS
ncbi:efflux RND transporter permease subunit [Roseomonas sp. KE2513]|uniref:efflux RND transporter permease subunit n=1 Tax=Roseomonas sp. KE2513 TaxID=2479202 RepID=UPI0021082786|nr:efflux RND transporter permease subunit [Roseomonas sp. KE2513]